MAGLRPTWLQAVAGAQGGNARIAADMRVGLDVQGCLQYSTERGVLCSGDQGWMASTVVGPSLFLPRYRRLRTRG